ncbi:MAG: TolC family protein [Myxococcota bacterium]|jgi:outer membrane protein TolC|nr:TolC family protein [Myxococcota bacterium]
MRISACALFKPSDGELNVFIQNALYITFVASASFVLPLTAHAGTSSPELTRLVSAVLQNNPELIAIEELLQSLKHQTQQASVWQDPSLAVEYSNMPLIDPRPGKHPMSGVHFKVQQVFPWPGKIDARKNAQSAVVRIEEEALAEKKNQLIALVKRTYYRLTLTRELRTLTMNHLDLVKQFIEVIRVRYEVGRVGQSDILRLEVQRDRLRDELRDFHLRDTEFVATLNAAIRQDPGNTISTQELPQPPALKASLNKLIESAARSRPLLAKLSKAAYAAELKAQRFEKEGRPDLRGWVGYRMRRAVDDGDSGEDLFSAGLSIPLPWFWNDRRWGELAAAHRATKRSIEAGHDAARYQLRGQLDAAVNRWRRMLEKAQTYEIELVPAAQKTLEATFAAYQVGQSEFASLFQAEVQLLDFERTIRVAKTNALLASIEVDTLVGAHLNLQGVNP